MSPMLHSRFRFAIVATPMVLAAIGAMACSSRGTGSASAAAPVRSDTTATGLYYEVSGHGETVVLIPAFSMDRRMWDEEAKHLAARYQVIRYDLRGHGLSGAIDGAYSASDDLREVLDAAAVQRAALVGLSNGGRIAIDFAVRFPERVTRLGLLAPGLSGYKPTGGFEWMTAVIAAVRAGDLRAAAERWAETPLMAASPDSAVLARIKAISVDNAKIWGYRTNPETPIVPPAIDRLNEITVPVLLIAGDRDLIDTHRVVAVIAEKVPQTKKVLIRGAGHMLNLEAPAQVDSMLYDFLNAGR